MPRYPCFEVKIAFLCIIILNIFAYIKIISYLCIVILVLTIKHTTLWQREQTVS